MISNPLRRRAAAEYYQGRQINPPPQSASRKPQATSVTQFNRHPESRSVSNEPLRRDPARDKIITQPPEHTRMKQISQDPQEEPLRRLAPPKHQAAHISNPVILHNASQDVSRYPVPLSNPHGQNQVIPVGGKVNTQPPKWTSKVHTSQIHQAKSVQYSAHPIEEPAHALDIEAPQIVAETVSNLSNETAEKVSKFTTSNNESRNGLPVMQTPSEAPDTRATLSSVHQTVKFDRQTKFASISEPVSLATPIRQEFRVPRRAPSATRYVGN